MTEQRLTKKQQKASKHRESRSARKQAKLNALQDVPEAEDDADEQEPPTVTKSKGKRKREEQDSRGGEPTAKKSKNVQETTAPSRLICFCGNLPYDVTVEQLEQHFLYQDLKPSVRLRSTKATEESSSKSKGYAFLEFANNFALQNALKLHHSLIGKRKINVELSAGGGGNSAARLNKIAEGRKKLSIEREKRSKKIKEAAKEKESKRVARTSAPKEDGPKTKPVKQPWLSGANSISLG